MPEFNEAQPLAHARRLALDLAYNVRDIGGYRTVDGRHTKWRVLYRSDSLHRLTPAAQQELLDLGLRTVIDLRYREELAGSPSVFVGSSHLHYRPIALYELDDPAIVAYRAQDLDEVYRMILAHSQPQFKRIIDVLTEPVALPALAHCTAGKDRTGMVIALILGAVGVPDETIVEDYALSGAYLETLLSELRVQAARDGLDMDWYERLLVTDPATMQRTLAHLRERYGDARSYLRVAGVTTQQLQQLESALLE